MASTKLLKYGKKPKANASVQVMQNYIAKCKEIDKKNAARKADKKKAEGLKKQIANIGRAK
jgi:hypothetical protein